MAYKQINSGSFEQLESIRIDEYVNQVTRFKLLDFKENLGKFNNTVYTVEVEGGKKVQFWGNTVVNKYLPNIEFGSNVAIVYLGEVAGKGGGNAYKNFQILVDDGKEGEDEVDLSPTAPTTAPATAKRKNPAPF